MKTNCLTKSGYLFIYLFILSFFSSCSEELIEIGEKPCSTTSTLTRGDYLHGIDVETLKEAFKIDPSFTKDPSSLVKLANVLNFFMPGAKMMIDYFKRHEIPLTLVYNPNAMSSMYVSNGYGNISGNVIVLRTLDTEDVLEEFFHANWATSFRDGVIPVNYKLNAEIDAKIYVSFIMSAQAVKDPKEDYQEICGSIRFYGRSFDLFRSKMIPIFKYYFFNYQREYDISNELYLELYDAFALDVQFSDCAYKDFKGVRGYLDGKKLIFDMLNAR